MNAINIPFTKPNTNPNPKHYFPVPIQRYLKCHTIPNPQAKSSADINYETRTSIPRFRTCWQDPDVMAHNKWHSNRDLKVDEDMQSRTQVEGSDGAPED
ncbi:hypothetical protein H920_06935 [Fukomys damarensis]|uniref:Uncharacterized protein n=1 Tax=Fukomys damarensis TaxID=885580 RepID=A0A091E977_FUKDA|nr:hypothetical protein H920_06935 [Fukomys damarensis]